MKHFSSSVLLLCLGVSGLIAGCGGGGSNNGGSGGNGSGGGTQVTAPTVTSISPTTAPAGSAALTLTVNGTGFTSSTTIQVGGAADVTKYVSATQVTATVEPAQMVNGGDFAVIAANGSVSSAASPAVNLEITNPAPTITDVLPAKIATGSASLTVTVTGTGFVPATVINVNGTARTTIFVSSTQVSVLLTAADVASSGNLSLTAVNAAPGGGTSAAATLAVANPAPNISTLSPNPVLASASTPPTITVTGTGFVSASTVQVNGSNRATTYVSATQLTFQLTAADQSTAVQRVAVTVVNPTPGGGTSVIPRTLTILQPLPTPVISQISPTQFVVGSGNTTITVTGTNMVEQGPGGLLSLAGSIAWNGTPLQTQILEITGAPGSSSSPPAFVTAPVPASLLASIGTASITFVSTVATPATSNALQVSIINPPAPTLTSISPASGPTNTAASVTLYGTGFTSTSTVAVNGVIVPSTYGNSGQLTATIPAASVAVPGNASITVTTPAPGGGTTSPLSYTAYVAIPNNDIAYNAADGLIYASVPGASVPGTVQSGMGNSVIGIDPVTGNVMRTIWVGSQPNQLALSADGKQLFVGLDGAGAVAQVDLTTGKPVNQFTIGGGAQANSPIYTATSLAAVPGEPNSVAVLASSGVITIYDSGVARAKNSSSLPNGYFGYSIAFGSSASTLYASTGNVEALTVDSTGITAGTVLYANGTSGIMQYDNGRLYLPTGVVLNASSGALQGTFYATADATAQGPVVSDSTLGRAFIANQSYTSTGNAILAFNESTFDPAGSISYNTANNSGYYGGSSRIIRWGQNGVALTSQQVLYIFQSPVVKDISSSPADLSIALTAPATAATGSEVSYVATVTNNGPNSASGATVALNLDASLILDSVTASQGSCGAGSSFVCNLGALAKGATATVTVTAKSTAAGTLNASATADSVSYDPTADNNQATASTTVTGDQYSAVPSISAISPNLVQAGSSDFTLTVTGSGFNAGSTVNLGTTALTTTYVSATQLTATVAASAVASYGWSPVTVANPTPGGGSSQVAPLTVYGLVNVPANSILFDPFSQQIYASVPSAATTLTGNSIVSINPVTGSVGKPVLVGSEPNAITETSDGNYLYAALTGANSIAQFNLLSQKLTATIPVTATGGGGTTGSVTPTWLAAMPGSDTTLAVDIANGWNNFGIFDISGNTGSFRTNYSGYYDGIDPVFADATHLYAYNGEFYRYTVDANGLTDQDGWTLNGLGGSAGSLQLANGIVYGGSGGIIDPRTTPPTQLATLPPIDFYQSGISAGGVGAVPDASTHKDFLMLENAAGTWEYALARYDTTTYLPEVVLPLPTTLYSIETNWNMLRWGQDGLALLAGVSVASGSESTSEVILLRGPFVTPQLLGTNSAATLTSSSVSSIAHGSGNTVLTLTGSNFAPGVAVAWNGNYRTTTIVDATHVTVAIPASDLAAAGSASVVATNPGAAASSALTVTIN
jgi:sugar lactone lactonase YvrE